MFRIDAVFAFLLLLVVCTSPAFAQENDWQDLLRRGEESFNAMKADEASSLLTRALEVMPDKPENLAARIKAHQLRSNARNLTGGRLAALNDARVVLALTKRKDDQKPQLAWVRPLLDVVRLQDLVKKRRDALKTVAEAITIAEKLEKKNGPLIQEALHAQCRLLRLTSDWQGAAKSLKRYIGVVEASRGANHPDIVGALSELAHCLKNSKDFEGAITTMNRWVSIYETKRGEGTPASGTGLQFIAKCQVELNRPEAAEIALDRWQAVLLKVTPKHPELVNVLYLRAKIDRQQAQFKEECAHLEEACQRMIALPEPDMVKVGAMKKLLCESYRKQEKHDAALQSIQEALTIYTKKLRKNDPQRIQAREERGRAYLAKGELKEAKRDFEFALKSFQKMAHDKHPVLRPALEGLLEIAKREKSDSEEKRLAAWLAKLP